MSCIICLRDDFTNYTGKDISWTYEGYSDNQSGPFLKVPECFLQFDGVDDIVIARNSTDYDVTTGDFDIEVEFRTNDVSGNAVRLLDKRGQGARLDNFPSYQISPTDGFMTNAVVQSGAGVYIGTAGSPFENIPYPNDGNWHSVRLVWENATGTGYLYIDGNLEAQETNASMIGQSISNARNFAIGGANTLAQYFQGDIRYVRFNTDEFLFTEGTGTTLTSEQGVVMDINGATWGTCVDPPAFDETCMSGPNPCFDAEGMTPGYYKFTYTKGIDIGDVYLYVSGSENAGNPAPNTYCYQGLPIADPNATIINLQNHFIGASKYNIVYQGGALPQFDGANLEISSLEPGDYCFTNVAEKELPAGWVYEDCVDCNDYESVCITITNPLNAGDNRVINVCNNVAEVFYQDYLVNNDGVGQFIILEDNLTAGTLDSEKYIPDLTDVGSSFKIAHQLEHPVASNCIGIAILEFNVVDCVPEPECVDDSALGMTITEVANGSPVHVGYTEQLTVAKTGTYADAGVIATDEIYFSNDDGATWILGETVKDDDYYVRIDGLAWQNTCTLYRVHNLSLTTGEPIDEATIVSRAGNFNAQYTNVTNATDLDVTGSCSAMINERYYRWNIKHVLNSGWELVSTVTFIALNDPSGCFCAPGPGSQGVRTIDNADPGKRKILFERRITYTNDCNDITIEGEFNPTLPECPVIEPGLGFDIDPPTPGFTGWVRCAGTVAGSTSDRIYVFEQPTGTGGYADTVYSCGSPNGSTNDLYTDNSYLFQRIITFANCPPLILYRDYQAATTCPTAGISCSKEDSNSRAKAVRVSTPFNLSSDYLQFNRGGTGWQSYTEGQWIYTTGTQNVQFRRVANYSNGCSQTTQSCSVTVSPPSHSLTISCSGNYIIISAVDLPSGGKFYLYKDGGFLNVGINSTGDPFPITSNGNYQVIYRYNQYQHIDSNTVNCGSSGCTNPTISIGACSVNGTTLSVPIQTSGITSIGQISASITPGSGTLVWSSGSGYGTITIEGTPGQTYTFDVIVTNSCGSDSASRTCSIGCSTLTIDNVVCNFSQNRTYFSVYVSPNTGQTPIVTGGTYTGGSGNRYDFYVSGTSGTITANHPQGCSEVNKTITCTCSDPAFSLSASCALDSISYSFTVTNQGNAGNYTVKVNGNTVETITNNGSSSYSGTYPVAQGSSNTVQISTPSSCGGTISSSIVNANCGCNDPAITATASCSTTTVSYSFTVTNEAQVTGNYSVKLNGSTVQTKINNGSGVYSGTIPVTAGTNNTIQISAGSQCGGTINSNIASANCGCPASSLSISNTSCNATTQILTFNVNQTNVSGTTLTVNGNPVAITGNPQTVQGIPGANTVSVSGTDSCASTSLSDSVVINCNCTEPSISLSASCNTSGLITYNFTVSNESRTDGNYTVLIDGVSVGTKTNTSAGSYSGSYQGSSGTNYTVRIRVPNKCGNNTLSNQISTSCGCPASSLAISSPSCNSTNQMISFTVSSPNSTVTSMTLNGSTIVGSGPWQGVIGSNEIIINGTDDCTGAQLSDTRTISCGCSLNPTVQIDSMSESSGVLTVNYSTTNITAASQIVFRGNGTIRAVTNLGSGNWRSTFSLVEGSNSISVTVSNDCGTGMDTDTYNYTTCVAPYLAKLYEGCENGYLYIYTQSLNITHADITTTPASVRLGSGSGLYFRFSYGTSSTINWNISGSTDCGSVGFGGTSSICPNVEVDIVSEGCSATGCADYLFVLDNSGSISSVEFVDFANTVKATIDQIDGTTIDARYAIAQFSTYLDDQNVFLTQNFTSSAATAKNISRWREQGIAFLSRSLDDLLFQMGSTINPRAGCTKHLLIFTDDSERITPFSPRNFLVADGWIISVIKYPIASDTSISNAEYAATASKGGSYNGSVAANSGDPEGSGGPRRLYLQSGFTGNAIPGLIDGIIQDECYLKAYATGCLTSGSYSWSTSGGSIISGQGTNTIRTNGIGSYTVTFTANTCNVQDTYNF